MNTLEENLILAKYMYENGLNLRKYTDYRRIYSFTTENITGYIDYFDLKDKSLLTVGSSADQAINASLKGAKYIDILDINAFTKYYYYLKKAGLLSLSYISYFEFFRYFEHYKYDNNFLVFSSYIYNEKIKNVLKDLDGESFAFWNTLFNKYDRFTLRCNLFMYDEYDTKILKKINPYLENEDNYKLASKRIEKQNVGFINDSIDRVILDKSYDNIWLSNIAQRAFSITEYVNIIKNYFNYLNIDGRILIDYIFKDYKIKENKNYSDSDFVFSDAINEFKKLGADYKTFIGIDGLIDDKAEETDGMIIYHKLTK